MPILLPLLLAVPLIEIWLLIRVGGIVGAGWTVFLVVFTAFIGIILVRIQGLSTLMRMQQTLARGELPALAMLEGIALLFAGALLLTPGFFTDALGFLLLVPAFRRGLIRAVSPGLLGHVRPPATDRPNPESESHRTLEGESRREKD
jgi:UPF0716 protein FxsA